MVWGGGVIENLSKIQYENLQLKSKTCSLAQIFRESSLYPLHPTPPPLGIRNSTGTPLDAYL